MSKFSLKETTNKRYILFYNKKPFRTFKGKSIFVFKIKSKSAFIKKISNEFTHKNSNFIKLLFFSNDIDKKYRKVIIDDILNYIDTDTVCFRNHNENQLKKLEIKRWDHYLDFCDKYLSLDFHINNSIIFKKQKKKIHNKIFKIISSMNNYTLSAFYFLVTVTNSIIITLNLVFNNTNIDLAWEDSNLEYEYNQKLWGKDDEFAEKFLLKKSFFIDIINFISFFDREIYEG
ncbi:MAG: hypothetical protein CMJ06_03735 [Pelagibacterales bacterium]|nr:hypothetical protein [Pelagibacterales bacterium]OUU62125.1 MAG: hypothetical protein CBC22_05185 [Alphaproteobacteria bacterium TMED62]|tara:strand:- start:6681 stop:7373 length:693 start_codon:yes stop_codon:yes gene_type:complete